MTLAQQSNGPMASLRGTIEGICLPMGFAMWPTAKVSSLCPRAGAAYADHYACACICRMFLALVQRTRLAVLGIRTYAVGIGSPSSMLRRGILLTPYRIFRTF